MENKNLLPFEKTPLSTSFNVKSVITVHYFKYGQKFAFEGETHDFWELVYIDSGEATVTADEKSFTLTQGEAYFHKPNEYHTIATKDFANSVIISFECHSAAMKAFEDRHVTLNEQEKSLLKTIVTEGSVCFTDRLSDVYMRKLHKARSAPFGAEQMIKTCLEQLLILLVRSFSVMPKTIAPTVASKNLSDRIKQILLENVYTEISLARIASELFFSVTYIKTTFKKSTGKSVMQYFAELKVEEAKRLISLDRYTFMEIAYKLGYSSLHYFSRQFKKVTGITPSQYAKSIKVEGVL